MSPVRLVALLALTALPGVLACRRDVQSSAPDAGAPSSSVATAAGSGSSAPGEGGVPEAGPMDAGNTALTKAKSIGHTSVVFKLTQADGSVAAFKPRSRRGLDRYRGEIVAHAFGRALGLANVPPAFDASVSARALREALAGDAAGRDLFDAEAVPEPDGSLRGARIPWIQHLEILPLENAEWRRRWSAWNAGTTQPPAEQREMARQIAILVLFDYLIGNWDRWSGANVGYDRSSNTLLFIDNDGAFFDPPPAKLLAAQRELVRQLRTAPADFVERLRGFDADAGRAAARDLLTAGQLAGVEARRREILEILPR